MSSAANEREGTIRDAATGELFIPASKRPDGSWRKPIKVKEGYIPQEEVPAYENKGVQWLKSKPSLPPGLSVANDVSVSRTANNENEFTEVMSKSAKKNLKRKEKKQQNAGGQHESNSHVELPKHLNNLKIHENAYITPSVAIAKEEADQQDLNKKLRNLKKKLRQITDLENQINSGSLKPEKEQLEKVKRKSVIEDEIAELEEMLNSH